MPRARVPAAIGVRGVPGLTPPPAAYTASMQGILTGGLLVAAFLAVAGAALAVLLRLLRISKPSRGEAHTGG